MPGRTIAIGDIHGYSAALTALLEAIEPRSEDTIVTLGDYVDRGPDSSGVIEILLALQDRCRLVPILGNHDEMLLAIRDGEPGLADWLGYGGNATLASYNCTDPKAIPEKHVEFLRGCIDYYETPTHFFVHASYVADLPLEQQPTYVLRWESLRRRQPGPHCSEKIAVVGHTAQKDGNVLDLGYLKCIDTCCYCGLWLTAIDVEEGRVWQSDSEGQLREEHRR